MQVYSPETAIRTDQLDHIPLIRPEGFREYDARWWYGFGAGDSAAQINLAGIEEVGLGLATMLRRRGLSPDIVVGHDLRSYSQDVKLALINGLLSGGAHIHDIGLALTPMAYFAQYFLDIPSVAMITASHNENGWTGVKMGCDRPYSFGPEDMAELKAIVLERRAEICGGGTYRFIDHLQQYYCDIVSSNHNLKHGLKVVVACGNGTAGLFAPQILRAVGCQVIEVDCAPDWSFPNYNPDPEAAPMQTAMIRAVKETGADLAFGFDGDGDRCGVVDNEGQVLFADRIGLLLAREFSRQHQGAHFLVDVKSTCLFENDPVLQAHQASVEYWKTGHSHIKRRMGETGALAAFEKSGHVFLAPPLGFGFDDGLATAIAICKLLDQYSGQGLAALHRQLPESFATPTLNISCCDRKKYNVILQVEEYFRILLSHGEQFAEQPITGLLTVNGARITVADGTWGLIRASSNKPELVIVAESPVSVLRRDVMLVALNKVLQHFGAGSLAELQ